MSLFLLLNVCFCGCGTVCFIRSHVSIGSDDDRCCPAAPQFVSADLTSLNSYVAVRGAETLSQVPEAAPTLLKCATCICRIALCIYLPETMIVPMMSISLQICSQVKVPYCRACRLLLVYYVMPLGEAT